MGHTLDLLAEYLRGLPEERRAAIEMAWALRLSRAAERIGRGTGWQCDHVPEPIPALIEGEDGTTEITHCLRCGGVCDG